MTLVYIMLAVSIVLSGIAIFLILKNKSSGGVSSGDKKDLLDGFDRSVNVITHVVTDNQNTFKSSLTERQDALEKRMTDLGEKLERNLKEMREANEKSIRALQEDNNKQLDKMRETVDEKLSATITERFNQSFDVLKKQLESVDKSLGEMQSVRTDVGSLTKMLSNVKTAGIFGEIQLGSILEQMLTPEQYKTNIVTGNAKEPVEFAVVLPGQNDGEEVLLPIDSKFPYTVYSDMQNAYEQNDFELFNKKKKELKDRIIGMAKDIQSKYINPPKTTNYAIMFLAIEGLYAEVAKMGLIEELQSKYSVTIAGPTTMSALLNSLKMGFRTLTLQKKSGEVWKVLSAVRTEFEKYNNIVIEIQKKFDETGRKFDTLVGTRTRMITSKLKNIDKSVERLDEKQSAELLELPDYDESEE